MTKFFVGLYNYFERHKVLFYLSLSVCILFMALFAAQVRFEENVTSFFPDTKDSQNSINVFENLKIKDKIMIMLSGKDGVADADSLIEAAETIKQDLQQQAEGTLIKEIFSKVDENLINSAGDFVYDNLPLFLSDEDYQRLDTLLTDENIAALMQKNYSNLISPAGFALKNYIMRDPLGLGSQTLKHLQDFQLEANYELINEHIFSRDGSTLLMFITPVFNTGSTGKNDKLIRLIEDELQKAEKEHPQLVAEYFGGPSVGVYNARQIKKDTLVTSSIALIIIIVFISLVFKHKKSIPLIITPVLFGALFALCLIYFIKGGISAIAVGAGSAVMGIALSYSIHMLAHQNHVSSVQQLIREIAYPLTVGSFTTIGAFFGLIFTSSNLLRDFGLFASLALIGTTLFCLVYLPHFLKGQAHVKQGAVLRFIEKLNAYPYEKNKGLVGFILILTLVCIFTSQNVRFNEDMMSLNYEPAHLKQAENKLTELYDLQKQTREKALQYAKSRFNEIYRLGCHLKETLAKYVFDETNEPEEPAEQEPNAPNIQEEVLGTKQTEYFNMELLSLIHVTCVGEQFENISEHDLYTCMNLLPSDTKPQIRPREKIRTCYLIFLMSEKLPKQDRENWKRNILKILDIEESYYKSKYKEPVSDFPSDSNRKFAKEMDGIFR